MNSRRWIPVLLLLFLAFAPAGYADDTARRAMRINLGGDESAKPNLVLPGVKVILAGPPWLQNTESLIIMGLFVWSLVWICRDAHRRGKSWGWAFIYALAACYPLSLIWWLWLRPPRQNLNPPTVAGTPNPVP